MGCRNVIITGGAGSLGLEMAKFLTEFGFKVIIFDIDDSDFALLNEKFECYKVDVTDESSILKAVDTIYDKYHSIYGLINNAGILHSAPMVNLLAKEKMRHSMSEFERVIKINLNSVFLVTSIITEKMVLNRSQGAIISISSISARGNMGQTAYSASKAGVEAMTKVWAKELGIFGLRFNAIAPGYIDTPSTHSAISENAVKEVISKIPLKKLGLAQNIAMSVVSCLENTFMNGSIIDINGGMTI